MSTAALPKSKQKSLYSRSASIGLAHRRFCRLPERVLSALPSHLLSLRTSVVTRKMNESLNAGRHERSRCGGGRMRVFLDRHLRLPGSLVRREGGFSVNQLRQLMLEELRRRNFAEPPSAHTFTVLSTSANTFIAGPINSARRIFASIRRLCSPHSSSARTP